MLQEFVHQIKKTAQEVMTDMHTALPAKIVSVNSSEGLATVQPSVKMTLKNGDKIDYPQISGVPIIFPQGSNQAVSISFPVKEGDSCLLVVSEQSLEYWLYERETDTTLRFDISNAICIPGLFQKPPRSFSDACDNDSVIIESNDTQISVDSNGIAMTGNVTINGDLTVTGSINNTQS